MAARVTLRFFAAAKAATGLDDLVRVTDGPPTLGDLVAGLTPAPGTDPDELSRVLDRCSFLVDGVSTRDRAVVLTDGAVVDVMPPFAGG